MDELYDRDPEVFRAGQQHALKRALAEIETYKPAGDGKYEDDWELGYRHAYQHAIDAINYLIGEE